MQHSQYRNIENYIKLKLSEEFGKEVLIKSNTPIGGGCISNALKLDTSVGVFFLKWNNNCASDLFLREAESLIELGKVENPFLRIPNVYVVEEEGSIPGFILMEFLLPATSSLTADEDLARGLGIIHKHTNNNFGFYNNNYCGATQQNNNWNHNWIDFFGIQRLWHIIKLITAERGLPKEHLKIYGKLIGKLPELIPNSSQPVLIHGDLWSGNYMLTVNGPALIDPAAYYANREMEMAIMTMFGGFSQRFYDAYNEINPLPSNWIERNKLYQLYHILNHYRLFGGSYKEQAILVAKKYL
jgi:fructosamine-3-kinase